MASYHIHCKTIGRSAGRSATAAAAYRSAERIRDMRTGEEHDYRRKRGVLHREIVLPPGAPAWAANREQLWNAAEAAETRKNSTVAREFELSLPAELAPEQRQTLAVSFARELVDRHGCAVDVAIHAPHRDGDERNHHAHLLCSTRRLRPEGFKEKTRELDDQRSGEIVRWRERWASLQNEQLQKYGHDVRVDHRTLEEQGIDRAPTHHRGPAITAIERRGEHSVVRERWTIEDREDAVKRLQRAAELGRLEREAEQVSRSIIDLSNNIPAARLARDVAATADLAPTSSAQVRSRAQALWQQFRAQDIGGKNQELDLTKDRTRGLGGPGHGHGFDP